MKTKFTKGPWRPREYPKQDGSIWIDADHQKAGTLAVALRTGTGNGSTKANADLIAAAPDLFAACEFWLEYEGKSCLLLGIEGWCGECGRCITRAAIEKATGVKF